MSSREKILDGALGLLRDGATVSLESAAQRAGLTKPGLMHHFRTKEALMLALVDHVADQWERQFTERLPVPLTDASPRERVLAYLDWSLSGIVDSADLVMLSDPRLRDALTARWEERLAPWIGSGSGQPAAARAPLTAVRLLADGVWLADATGILPVPDDERDLIRALALRLLDGGDR